jgi:hypothetical protein
MDMKESKAFWSRKRPRGQSLVEFALMAPILLILLSGLFEFGFLFTQYLAVLDSARNAARFSSDTSFDMPDDTTDCSITKYFYRQTACEAVIELANEEPSITLCIPGAPVTPNCPNPNTNPTDDVIISVFSVLRKPGDAITRFPTDAGEMGWSYDADLLGQAQGAIRTGMHVSTFTTAKVQSMLEPGTNNTGYVLVEINYNYHQILGLPWFTQFVGDPIRLNLYAMWPCASAEPTPTPK